MHVFYHCRCAAELAVSSWKMLYGN